MAGNWSIVERETSQNLVLNPSAEATGNFANAGTGTVTRVTTASQYEAYSFRLQDAVGAGAPPADGGDWTLSTLGNTNHYLTLRVDNAAPNLQVSLDNVNYHDLTLISTLDSTWYLQGYEFPNTEANGSTTLYIHVSVGAAADYLIDGIQVEAKTGYYTTYIDGRRKGCVWDGPQDAGTSTRSALSLAGGRLREFEAIYYFYVDRMVGVGVDNPTLNIDEFAILPGGELNSRDRPPREFVLAGTITGTSLNDLNDNRQALLKVLNPDVPEKQPITLRYDGATTDKEIECYYLSGLDASIQAETARINAKERVAIRFVAVDPNFLELGRSVEVLNTSQSATFRITCARFRSTGEWDELGPPNVAGTYTSVEDIAIDADKTVYLAGNFLNFDNIAAADRFVSYNPITSAFAAIGAAGTFNDGIVQTIAIAPNGDVYVGGSFTTGGGSVADYIAFWNGAAWAAVGNPLQGAAAITIVNDLVFGLDGTLYVGGDFVNWANIAAADEIVQWDGTTYTAMGTGITGTGARVIAMDVAPDGTLYVGGDFTGAGGVAVGDLASWDGTAWADVGGGVAGGGDIIGNIVAAKSNLIYIGGNFVTAGGVTVNNICIWNGITFTPLGSGTNGLVESLALGPDGVLYAGGSFTTAGGLALADRAAKWTSDAWAHLDVDLPGTPTLEAIAIGNVDPVVPRNYDIWLGFTTTGTATFAQVTTVTNDGTVEAFPELRVNRSGGTSATVQQMRNETTGRELLFDYGLLDGETLIVDLDPRAKTVSSDFFGPRQDALLSNSDFGVLNLISGGNDITVYILTAGGPTITASLGFRDPFDGVD